MILYMTDAQGANAHPYSINPSQLLQSVQLWRNNHNTLAGPNPPGLGSDLQINFPRFVPAWLRLCSAVSRHRAYTQYFEGWSKLPERDLAEKIFDHATHFVEAAFDWNNIDKKRAIDIITWYLQDDPHNLQSFSHPMNLLDNGIARQVELYNDPYDFDTTVAVVDKVNDMMELNFLSSIREETAEDFVQYCKDNFAHYGQCLPMWVRSVIDRSRAQGVDIHNTESLVRMINSTGEKIVKGRDYRAAKAIRDLEEQFPGCLDIRE